MNSKERLTRIFRGLEVDRPALKLWGLSVGQKLLHDSYSPVYNLAMEKSDIVESARSKFDIILGSENDFIISRKKVHVPNSNWIDEYTIIQLKDRKLQSIYRYSLIDEPGYTMEYLIKEPDDLKALLEIDYKPYPIITNDYYNKLNKIGNRGVVLFELDHAAYAVNRLMGSETFAYMSLDNRGLITEAIDIYSQRIIKHTTDILDAGITPIFGWVGPELCIPPLTRMQEFEDFVFNYDKKLCDLIHNAGGNVWVHCHGRVGNLLDRFIEMGVDVLNPIEPPPQGDITLKDAINKADNKIGLEGNIEISILLLEKSEVVEKIIDSTVNEAKKSNRFIICPSAGYMEYINPSPQYIKNLMIYLNRGYMRLIE